MIRRMKKEDNVTFLELAKEFYHSNAVLYAVPPEFHSITFEEIIRSDAYLEGYIFDGKV